MAQGKKRQDAKKSFDNTKMYSVEEAVALLAQVSYAKFDPSIEVAIKTNANPKYNDQMLRSTTVLPHGTGKKVIIAAFVEDDQIKDAEKAGASIAGNDQLADAIQKGEINFDILITSPDMMKNLTKVAKVLGPKGLMPSPKAGTVTQNVTEAIQEIKKGRVEFRLDKTGNVHAGVGKLSFGADKITENINHLIQAVNDSKPEGVKGKLIKKIVISPSMGPAIQIAAQ